MLVKYVHSKHDDWDEFLETCTFAYNTSVQESTQYSPFELMFGRKATLPIDLEFGRKRDVQLTQSEEFTVSEVEALAERRRELIEQAKENIKMAQQKQKQDYDRRHARPEGFQVTIFRCAVLV